MLSGGEGDLLLSSNLLASGSAALQAPKVFVNVLVNHIAQHGCPDLVKDDLLYSVVHHDTNAPLTIGGAARNSCSTYSCNTSGMAANTFLIRCSVHLLLFNSLRVEIGVITLASVRNRFPSWCRRGSHLACRWHFDVSRKVMRCS